MKIEAALCSSLIKAFPDTPVESDIEYVSLLKGERGNIQILLKSDCDTKVRLETFMPGTCFYEVKEIYSALPIYEDCGDTVLLNEGKPGFYPDLLSPNPEIELKKDCTKAVWMTIDTARISTVYSFSVNVISEDTKITLTSDIKIWDTPLPPQELIHINWFHTDCLATYYDVPVFSEEHWGIVENFIKNAVSHGINCILTPLFTPPLDTEVGGERPTVQLVEVKTEDNSAYEFGFSLLDRWVDMCLSNGVTYFELSHLFTQWGAEHAPKIMAETPEGEKRIFGWDTEASGEAYMNFLSQFGPALKEYTDKKGITDKCFIHCSDEPGLDDIENYRKASDAVRKYFPAYEHIDALSDYDFYKEGLIGTPVPEEGRIDDFKGNVPKLWTYYCCGQFRNNLPNRFFAMPSIKTRILGTLLYKYECTGFLQWGFNFYYSQYSKHPIDPYKISDAGEAFPSGDAYIVYPGENGIPLPSIRQKVFYDGFQDMSALKALERKYSREYVLGLIKEQLGDITFTDYPLDNKTFLNFRYKVNECLQG